MRLLQQLQGALWTGEGKTSAGISTVLDISERTVSFHPNPTNKSPWG